MPVRPTRSIALLLAVLALFSTVSILESRLKSYTRNRFSIITAPVQSATPPPPQIVDFWAQFAKLFDSAKPKCKPLPETEYLSEEDLKGSDEANGEREPFPQSLGIPPADVKSLAQAHLKIITDPDFEKANERAPKLYSGRGIVTVAGGPYFAPAILAIRMLRKTTNSTLPVQVFLQNKAEYEREICEEILPSLNAECYIVEDFLRPGNPFRVSAYQLKVLAMLFSSFEKVLFLDSDCMALRDPIELFASEPFKSTGLLSWSDYWIATEDAVFYEIAGLAKFPKGVPARSSETGQLMVDKSKHLSSLLLAAYYNIFGPDFYYPILSQGAQGEGDKETFLAGAVVLGKKFYRVAEHVGTVGYHAPDGEFHGGGMVQYSAADEWTIQHGNLTEKAKLGQKPRPFFLHANVPKMSVGHLLDTDAIFLQGTEQRIRLWGPPESMTKMFGYDVELVAWNEMRHMACDLRDVLADFQGRWKLCERANNHYKELFDPQAVHVPTRAEKERKKKEQAKNASFLKHKHHH